jgi:iron complex transport system substrate-binding protein
LKASVNYARRSHGVLRQPARTGKLPFMAGTQRIVSLISSATEILYLLGLGDRVAGVSHECDYPSDVAGKPRLTRSLVDSSASSRTIDEQVRTLAEGQSALYAIDIDALAALAPEVIITQTQCDVCAVRYEDVVAAVRDVPALNHARVLALNPRSLADVFGDILRVGEVVGEREAAVAAVESLRQRVDAVRSKTVDLPPAEIPRTACLEWIDPPMLAANWTPELVEMAGGAPGLALGERHSTYADWNAIVEYDPQVVIAMPCGFDLERSIVEAQALRRFSRWAELSAVGLGRAWAVDGNAYFNRSGPRLVDSLEILAHLLHPQRFAPPAGLAGIGCPWRRLETRI